MNENWDRQKLRSQVRATVLLLLILAIILGAMLSSGSLQERLYTAVIELAFICVGVFFKNTGDVDKDSSSKSPTLP